MFITDLACISPQHTFSGEFLSGNIVSNSGNRYQALEPDYKGIISVSSLRRMAKALRMGVGAGALLLGRNPKPDGMVIGTAYGGLDHCLKFLNQIVEFNESTLTPTNFVQSTPNNIASQLSLLSGNSGYNTTHVHKGLAFETALIDAMMFLETDSERSLLVGATEEISEYNFSIDEQAGLYKKEETTSDSLLSSDTPGTVCGEGAAMFMVKASCNGDYYARIKDVAQLTYPEGTDVIDSVETMLNKNGLKPEDIKGYIAGISGDNRNDFWYHQVNLKLFSHLSPVVYKNWTGDFPTASAFALWLACHLLSGTGPDGSQKLQGPVLIYNHYIGDQHGLILLDT